MKHPMIRNLIAEQKREFANMLYRLDKLEDPEAWEQANAALFQVVMSRQPEETEAAPAEWIGQLQACYLMTGEIGA